MLKIRLLENKLLKIKLSNIIPRIVLAKMQEKEVVPTKEIQEILPDKNFDGLSKVIVDKIPDEYVIPSGNLEISQNGTFDVTDKANAIVNVPEKKLGTKTITTNGTYKAIDDNLDGYNEVEVTTSGVDINEYLNNTLYNASSAITSCGSWLFSIKKLPQDVHLDEYTTTCNRLFAGYPCKTLNLSNFDTSKVTDMGSMFRDCQYVTTLNLSNFDTSKVTDMSAMFYVCNKLSSLNLSNFNTAKVTSMASMFNSCVSLTNLDLSSFNVANVTNVYGMFQYCSSLTSLDLSSFNTANVTDMRYMFQACSKLKNLNISNFDFTKVTNHTGMFANVPNNCYILVKDAEAKEWITTKFTNLTNVHYVGEEG